jgi:hypothetical protein
LRVLSGSNLMKAEQYTEDSFCSSEHTGDVQTTQSHEINPVDSICPTEFVQRYKQSHRHKMQERIIIEDSPMLKSPFSGKDDHVSAVSSFIFNSLVVSKTKYRCLL